MTLISNLLVFFVCLFFFIYKNSTNWIVCYYSAAQWHQLKGTAVQLCVLWHPEQHREVSLKMKVHKSSECHVKRSLSEFEFKIMFCFCCFRSLDWLKHTPPASRRPPCLKFLPGSSFSQLLYYENVNFWLAASNAGMVFISTVFIALL